MSYNGWSNYETWNVALWISNDGSDDLMNERASEPNTSTGDMATFIEQYIDESNPIASVSSVYSDLLSAALREVNWEEIADGYLAENRVTTIECSKCLLDVDPDDYDSDLDMCHDCADSRENARLDDLHTGYSILCPRLE